MTDQVENLILVQMREMRNENQTRHDILRQAITDLTERVGAVEQQIIGLRRDIIGDADSIVRQQRAFDSLVERVERIERRLELS